MATCQRCGRKGLFLKLNANKICMTCEKEIAHMQERSNKQLEKSQELSDGHISYMPMVSQIPLKQNFGSEGLRTLLYKLSSIEGENAFVECGYFSHDDGKRRMDIEEAANRIGFFSDRLFEKSGDARYRVKSCTDPQKFFSYYSIWINTLSLLAEMEQYTNYHSPLPSEILREAIQNKAYYEKQLIKRSWESAQRSACRLKSESARKKVLATFSSSLHSFDKEFTFDAREQLNKIDDIIMNIDAKNMNAPEKDLPVFDKAKESELLSAYQNANGVVSKHFARNDLIDFYYKYRKHEEYLNKCEKLCLEDIGDLHQIDYETKKQIEKSYQTIMKYDLLDEKREREFKENLQRGFNGSLPSLQRLVMININRKDYNSALNFCNMAINYYKDHLTPYDIYQSRKERIIKLMKKTESQANKGE